MNQEQQAVRRRWPCGCIDLETLSTLADAVVLEIGCVLFDPVTGELGPEYQAEVEMRSNDQRLRAVDAATFTWWGERLKAGADMPGMFGGVSLWQGLQGLGEFFKGLVLSDDFEMWAWGSDFDFAILRDAHDDAQLELPWRYSRQCDARSFCGKLGVKRQGEIRHMALEDARQEATAVMAALARLWKIEGAMERLGGTVTFNDGTKKTWAGIACFADGTAKNLYQQNGGVQ